MIYNSFLNFIYQLEEAKMDFLLLWAFGRALGDNELTKKIDFV